MRGVWRFGTRSAAALAAVVALASVATPAVAEGRNGGDGGAAGATAVFEGRLIDLSADWEGAQVCLVAAGVLDTAECYATEAEAAERFTALGLDADSAAAIDGGGPMALAGSYCSSYLKLYDGTWYSGQSLWLSGRWSWYNLSVYGFDQKTSSFQVGACAAYFADFVNGGGAWYPTNLTQAYDVGPAMNTGWNDDVSSVYLT
jgi:hypothetical protein